MPEGSWAAMQVSARFAVPHLKSDLAVIPRAPGVYAWYRDGQPVYVGRATGTKGLHSRLSGAHLRTHGTLNKSSFRRNVAEAIGLGPSADFSGKDGRTVIGADLRRLNDWVAECEVAWIACSDPDIAVQTERALLAEFRPPLNKQKR